MLTPEQIAALRDRAWQITDPINDFLLEDIARRIAQAGKLTSTAAYQIWRAQQLGVSQRKLKQELRRRLGLSHQEIRRIMYQSAQSGYELDVSRFPYIQAVPFEQSAALQQIVAAAVELAQEDFSNIVQTIGFVNPYGKTEPLTRAYITTCDFAFKQVVTGAASYTEAIRQATRNLAKQGVRVIDYQSGVYTSLEAAVRRNILGGLGLMQEQISQMNHDKLGCNGWEITAHANSAPDHEPIQGKQYSDAAYAELNNGLVRRIGTLNCGHAAFPIILGVNRPQYTPEELEDLRASNEKGVVVDGRHYTGYEATQMQRQLERSIRRQKRRILVDKATGDENVVRADRIRLQRLHQEYERFSKAAGLKTQHERMDVVGFDAERPGPYRKIGRTFEQFAGMSDTTLPNGVSVRITDHVIEQAMRRDVSGAAAVNALQNPLKTSTIKYDKLGRPSYQLIGERATIVVNPETGAITSVWPTHTKVAKRLKEGHA